MTFKDKVASGLAATVVVGSALLMSGEEVIEPASVYVPQEATAHEPLEVQVKESPALKTQEETVAEVRYIPVAERQTETKSAPAPKKTVSCHSGYSGCLNPSASDYDCAGGSGNGPYYTGPVAVYGSDPYDLDRDGDGMACE
jgi:hypothetical protein